MYFFSSVTKFGLFEQVIGSLLSHDCVVTFESNLRREVLDESWNSWPCWVTTTAKALSYCNQTVKYFLGENSFHSRSIMVQQI